MFLFGLKLCIGIFATSHKISHLNGTLDIPASKQLTLCDLSLLLHILAGCSILSAHNWDWLTMTNKQYSKVYLISNAALRLHLKIEQDSIEILCWTLSDVCSIQSSLSSFTVKIFLKTKSFRFSQAEIHLLFQKIGLIISLVWVFPQLFSCFGLCLLIFYLFQITTKKCHELGP